MRTDSLPKTLVWNLYLIVKVHIQSLQETIHSPLLMENLLYIVSDQDMLKIVLLQTTKFTHCKFCLQYNSSLMY